MTKFKIVILTSIIAITLFFGLIKIEKILVNRTPTMKVVYCTKTVKQKQPLMRSDFIEKEVPITEASKETIKSLNEIDGLFAKADIYSGEALNKNRIATEKEVGSTVLDKDKRAMAIAFPKPEDVVGGSLRKGDIVDILYTTKPSDVDKSIKTYTLIKNLTILEAMDTQGKIIDESDKLTTASTFKFSLQPEMAHLITNIEPTGTLKLIQSSTADNSYNNITIINGQVVTK